MRRSRTAAYALNTAIPIATTVSRRYSQRNSADQVNTLADEERVRPGASGSFVIR